MKDLFSKALKHLAWIIVGNLVLGIWIGSIIEKSRIYSDCRYAGVTRMGEAAFKCEQFSKVVLLTPDEQVKKK